ncbi:hypothetical protein [Terrilactibacillus laevilacticus]|uniref:Uncharacterized protein n=1 Tax=Terrilactibacillus laevilacticus TaxID=1380157 RepID=A0ABW5PP75_9BACI
METEKNGKREIRENKDELIHPYFLRQAKKGMKVGKEKLNDTLTIFVSPPAPPEGVEFGNRNTPMAKLCITAPNIMKVARIQ